LLAIVFAGGRIEETPGVGFVFSRASPGARIEETPGVGFVFPREAWPSGNPRIWIEEPPELGSFFPGVDGSLGSCRRSLEAGVGLV
jgi:hypothetical protein